MAIAFLVVRMLCDCFKSRQRLEAEILVLRHQLNVLQQRAPRRVQLRWASRALFIWLYRCCPRILDAITIVRPETVVRWHRMGFAAYWRWKSRSPGGRPRIGKELRDLIRRMSFENPLSSDARCNTPRRFGIGRIETSGSVAMRGYSHLSDDEREQIGLLKVLGHSIGAIARALRRPKSTISRELSRNRLPSGRYSPLHAACRPGRPSFAITPRGLHRLICLWSRRLPLSSSSHFLFLATDGGVCCGPR